MGWDTRRFSGDVIDAVLKDYTWEDARGSARVLAFSSDHEAVYLALERHYKIAAEQRPINTTWIIGLVVLYRHGGNTLAVKSMTEFEGPYYYGASKEVLDLLSPLRDEPGHDSAREWRRKCRALVARRELANA